MSNPFNAISESAAYHSARAANDLRESLSYARQRAADNETAAAIATLAKGLRDARSSCTALNFTVWDEGTLAEICWRWISEQTPIDR